MFMASNNIHFGLCTLAKLIFLRASCFIKFPRVTTWKTSKSQKLAKEHSQVRKFFLSLPRYMSKLWELSVVLMIGKLMFAVMNSKPPINHVAGEFYEKRQLWLESVSDSLSPELNEITLDYVLTIFDHSVCLRNLLSEKCPPTT